MYSQKEIVEFVRAANKDLGSGKYKAKDVIEDYCKAIKIIQQLQAANRWIPVTERLPDEGQVVVLCDRKVYEVKIRVTEDEDDVKLTKCDIRHLGCVLLGLDECITHWKPIV